MKVKKKAVRSVILKLEKNVQITLDEDMNVPDTRPDVEKIIESRGEVHIDEIEVLTDRLRLRGNFLVQILYLSTDPEQQISCMEHDFAIEEFMNVEGAESSDITNLHYQFQKMRCPFRYIFSHCHLRNEICRMYNGNRKKGKCPVPV